MKPYLLGIDIGTSACKVAVFEKSGTVVAAANGDYPVYYPKEGWAEQDPEEWWSAVCQALKKAIQKAGIAPEEIAGIGIDGQSWSAIAMDKDLTKRLVAPLGIHTPQWQRVTYAQEDIPALVNDTALPVVVKPLMGGSSIGVSSARTPAELTAALEQCLDMGSSTVVLEQYVSGREIQVGYLVDRALPSIEIIPKSGFYDYENKYQPGAAEEITPAPIPPEWEAQLAQDTKTVFDALGLSVYSRADFIVDESGTPWFLEINTLPGFTGISMYPMLWADKGVDAFTIIDTLIAQAFKRFGA